MTHPHAIVFAFPFQGHITPTLNFSIKLASHGFTITYIQIQFIHNTIAKAHNNYEDDLFVEARKSGLDMRYATISDGFPLEFDRDLNLCEYWESMMVEFPGRVDEMVGNIIASHAPSTPFFLIADSMYTWASAIAMKHKLVHVSFWTASATTFSLNSNLDHAAMSKMEEPDAVTLLMMKVVNKAFEQVKNAEIILCNTVQQLESETLLPLKQKQPTYAIGPCSFFTEITNTKVENRLFCASDCTQWLDSKPPASVLYISFGSIYSLNNKQEIMEIAYGLLLSEVNFIWVVGKTNDIDDVFPIGFLEHVKDRGLIVPWCDQNMVLSNVAVVGFLTHCGWNSIMESVWNGVPMICRPVSVDQPVNRKLVVEDWKVGIDLCDEGQVVTREDVVVKIKVLMMGVELRQEMEKVRELLRNALDKDGSSQINFDEFVHHLKARLYAN